MKKIYLLLVLSFSFAFLFGCSKSNDAGKSIKDIVQDSSKKDVKAGDVTKNECMQGCQIMRKSNKGNEGRSSSDMQKDCNNLCEAGQGIQNNDLSSCEKSEGILRDGCYTEIAKTSKDADICKNIQDSTFLNACYSSVAEETKDVNICERIKENIFKDICVQGTKE